MPPEVAADSGAGRKPGGSELCVACGLCCNGTLHASVTVQPEHVELVGRLGLSVEKAGEHEFVFRQPCPLYQNDRCNVYPRHPPSCQEYRCALLRKYEAGDLTLDDSLTIARAARDLLGSGVDRLRSDLTASWGANGLQGSGALRQANAELALRAAALDVHLTKHFRLAREVRAEGYRRAEGSALRAKTA